MLLLHSGLRYVVLVAAVAVLGYGLSGIVTRRPFDERMRKLGSLLAVSLHLEILIGLGLLFTGSFSPAVTGHVFMMLFAAGAAQVVPSVMRRRPPEQRSYLPYIISTAVALALVAGGIVALGRPVLG
jgi:hypothetical protein